MGGLKVHVVSLEASTRCVDYVAWEVLGTGDDKCLETQFQNAQIR